MPNQHQEMPVACYSKVPYDMSEESSDTGLLEIRCLSDLHRLPQMGMQLMTHRCIKDQSIYFPLMVNSAQKCISKNHSGKCIC